MNTENKIYFSVVGSIMLVLLCLISYTGYMAVKTGFIDKEGATAALRANGFTDISITGRNWFACGNGDFYRTGFSAKNVRGETVYGTVCGGLLFKGNTIRWDSGN